MITATEAHNRAEEFTNPFNTLELDAYRTLLYKLICESADLGRYEVSISIPSHVADVLYSEIQNLGFCVDELEEHEDSYYKLWSIAYISW